LGRIINLLEESEMIISLNPEVFPGPFSDILDEELRY